MPELLVGHIIHASGNGLNDSDLLVSYKMITKKKKKKRIAMFLSASIIFNNIKLFQHYFENIMNI